MRVLTQRRSLDLRNPIAILRRKIVLNAFTESIVLTVKNHSSTGTNRREEYLIMPEELPDFIKLLSETL